jgi:hypothetical protein
MARVARAKTQTPEVEATLKSSAAVLVNKQILSPVGLASREQIFGYDGVQVFSATMAAGREHLGDRIAAWLHEHRGVDVVAVTVSQSSDERFHCLTVTLFWRSDVTHPLRTRSSRAMGS